MTEPSFAFAATVPTSLDIDVPLRASVRRQRRRRCGRCRRVRVAYVIDLSLGVVSRTSEALCADCAGLRVR